MSQVQDDENSETDLSRWHGYNGDFFHMIENCKYQVIQGAPNYQHNDNICHLDVFYSLRLGKPFR